MRQIILADRYKTHEIIQEEKEIWIKNLLIMLGIPADQIHEGNREVLEQYNLQVWDDLELGDIEVIKDDILVGKWYAPLLIAKCDETNKVYYEIHLDYDSIMDNEFNFSGDNI